LILKSSCYFARISYFLCYSKDSLRNFKSYSSRFWDYLIVSSLLFFSYSFYRIFSDSRNLFISAILSRSASSYLLSSARIALSCSSSCFLLYRSAYSSVSCLSRRAFSSSMIRFKDAWLFNYYSRCADNNCWFSKNAICYCYACKFYSDYSLFYYIIYFSKADLV